MKHIQLFMKRNNFERSFALEKSYDDDKLYQCKLLQTMEIRVHTLQVVVDYATFIWMRCEVGSFGRGHTQVTALARMEYSII